MRTRKTISARARRIALLLVPPLASAVYLAAAWKPEIAVVPLSPGTSVQAYGDSMSGMGDTRQQLFRKDATGVGFRYRLGSKYAYPYAVLAFAPPALLDLRGYDYMRFRASLTGTTSVKIYLKTEIPGLSEGDKPLSYRNNEKANLFPSSEVDARLSLAGFRLSPWWSSRDPGDESSAKDDFSRVRFINVESGYEAPKGEDEGILVRGLSFAQDRAALAMRAFLILVLASAAILAPILAARIGRRLRPIAYRPLSVRNHADDALARAVEAITGGYSDPDLDLGRVGRAAGIDPAKLGVALKSRYGLGFSAYVNSIRIAEARRLLAETDRQVTEIAFAVGFGSVANFNRAFRKATGSSPTEFRKRLP
jgi:AraC-like DNA-binding protein